MTDLQTQEILRDQITQAVIAAMGLEGINEEKQAELLIKMGDVVSDSILVALLRAIPDERREEFARALSGHDDAHVHKMLKTYIPDPNAFIMAAAQHEVEVLMSRFKAALRR